MSVPDVSDRALGALISLEGRVAVVTGGARNIGLAIARRINEAGARVVIADRDADEGTTAVSYLHSIGLAAEFVATDVTESSAVSAVADHVVDRYGTLDVWVNCAGKFPYRPALEITDDEWDDMIAVNLRGTFLGSREAARRMVRAGRRGVIVILSSCAAFRTGAGPLRRGEVRCAWAHAVAGRRVRGIRHSSHWRGPDLHRTPSGRTTARRRPGGGDGGASAQPHLLAAARPRRRPGRRRPGRRLRRQ